MAAALQRVWRITDDRTGKLVPETLRAFAQVVGNTPIKFVLLHGKKRQGKTTIIFVATGIDLPRGGGESAITTAISLIGPFPPQQIQSQLGPRFRPEPSDVGIVFVDTRGLSDLRDRDIELNLHMSLLPFQVLAPVRLLAIRGSITLDELRSVNETFKLHRLLSLASRLNGGARGSFTIVKTAHECCDELEAQEGGPTETDMRRESQAIQRAVDEVTREGFPELAHEAPQLLCLPDISQRNRNRERAQGINMTLLGEHLGTAIQAATSTGASQFINVLLTWASQLENEGLETTSSEEAYEALFQRVHEQVIDGVARETERQLLSASIAEIRRQPKQCLQRWLAPSCMNARQVGTQALQDVPFPRPARLEELAASLAERVCRKSEEQLRARVDALAGLPEGLGCGVNLVNGVHEPEPVLNLDMTHSNVAVLGGFSFDHAEGNTSYAEMDRQEDDMSSTQAASLSEVADAWTDRMVEDSSVQLSGQELAQIFPNMAPAVAQAGLKVGRKAASANVLKQSSRFVGFESSTMRDKCSFVGVVSLVPNGLRVRASVEEKFQEEAMAVDINDLHAVAQFWRDKPTHVQSAVGVGSRDFQLQSLEQRLLDEATSETRWGTAAEAGHFSALGISCSRNSDGQWGVNRAGVQQEGSVSSGTLRMTVGQARPAVIRPPSGTPALRPIWHFLENADLARRVELLYIVFEQCMCPPATLQELRQSPFFTTSNEEQEYLVCYKGDQRRVLKARVQGQHLLVAIEGASKTETKEPNYPGGTATARLTSTRSARRAVA